MVFVQSLRLLFCMLELDHTSVSLNACCLSLTITASSSVAILAQELFGANATLEAGDFGWRATRVLAS